MHKFTYKTPTDYSNFPGLDPGLIDRGETRYEFHGNIKKLLKWWHLKYCVIVYGQSLPKICKTKIILQNVSFHLQVMCRQAPTQSGQTCVNQNWWSSFDRRGECNSLITLYSIC